MNEVLLVQYVLEDRMLIKRLSLCVLLFLMAAALSAQTNDVADYPFEKKTEVVSDAEARLKGKQVVGPGVPAKNTSQADFIVEGPASRQFGGELSLWYASEYYFRGLRFSENDVSHQEVSLWYQGFKVKGFFNYDFHDDEFDEEHFNEADVTASYSTALRDDTALEFGYTYYGYPHQVMGYHIHHTQEFFAGIRQESDIIDASLYGYYDFTDGSGSIFELSVGKHYRYKSIDPYVKATADLNVRYFNDATEVSHAIVTAGLPIDLGDHFVLEGNFNYQWGFVSWVEDQWYVKAGVTFKF